MLYYCAIFGDLANFKHLLRDIYDSKLHLSKKEVRSFFQTLAKDMAIKSDYDQHILNGFC